MSVVTVTVLSEGKLMDPIYELVSLDIRKEVNRIPYAQLVLLDGDATKQTFAISDEPFFEPGKVIEIKLRYEDAPAQEATVFKGVVVGHGVEAGGQGSLLTVELKDAAIKLTYVRKSAIYRDQTDDKVIGQIISNNGLKKGSVPATQPQHAQLVQYYCTDWDFILSRAEAQGLLVMVDDGEISLPAIALIGQPKHTFEYGLTDIFNFEIEADAGHQYPDVQSIAWDIKNQKLTKVAKAKDFKLSQSNLNGAKIAKTIGVESNLLASPVPLAPKELQAWSDATLARSRMSMVKGRIAVPGFGDIKPLDIMEVSGIGKRFNGKTLVTGIRHQVSEQGWQTDVQFGLAAERFVDRRDIVDVPAAGLLPAVNGLQIGLVDQFEEDPDKEFRVKVILPGIDQKTGSIWARLASPDAGKDRGYFFRPEAGDEVVVGFFNDDPRQAVILGAMYSSKNTPPKDVSKLTKKNIDKAIVTKTGTIIRFVDDSKSSVSIETPQANKIILDDDAQTIEIADQHGNTITMSKDGIVLKSAKDLKIDASGNVEIKGQKVDVK
ncbi:MAG: type VI secretion system tip protein VgrG [Anaerolineae bacterium]|nr:type VI secretion system tip protein VgrG [Anaerolineae bacterium]